MSNDKLMELRNESSNIFGDVTIQIIKLADELNIDRDFALRLCAKCYEATIESGSYKYFKY